MVTITHRITQAVLYESATAETVRAAVLDAVAARADLTGANLADGKNLATVRADLHAVLDIVPQEVPALLAAVRAGKINGTVYEGECACLVGTIAKARGCSYTALPGLAPDSTRPAERWFLALMPGHTPDISIHAALTVAWIEDWLRTQVSLQRCGAVNENP